MSISAASSSSSVSESSSILHPNQNINHPQYRVNSEAICRASSLPSSMLSFGKVLVCKRIDSRYPSPSNPLMSSLCKDEKEENSPAWLHLAVVFLVSFKLQLLFEHLACFLSLVTARHLAITTKKELVSNIESVNKDPVTRSTPPSSFDQAPFNKNLIINKDISSKKYFLKSTCSERAEKNVANECQDRFLETQRSFPIIVTSSSISQTWSQSDETRDEKDGSSPLHPSELSITAIQNPISEEDNEDWGQFTEFEDDSGSHSNPYNMDHTPDDPFQSINKTMLKKRGRKVSVCKLERLQEGEEE